MKASEIRIGNYCKQITHSSNKVVSVSKEHFEVIEGDEIDLFPILLLEEWLLKFGFSYFGLGRYELGDFRLLVQNNYIVLDTGGLEPTIKYVHQLQNLYFALTGEELTIK